MRQIKIDKGVVYNMDGLEIACPVGTNGRERMDCGCNCAWFRIGKSPKTTLAGIPLPSEPDDPDYAYCGDKLIGEVKEKTDA